MPTAPPDNADLFEEVTRLDTLERAWGRVLRNAGAAGGDGLTVGRFAEAAPSRLLALHRTLRMGDYRPGPLRRLSIPKPDGALRPLAIPPVTDRVAQTAAALVLTPLLDGEFEDASFGYRPGRSVPQAVARVARWRDQGYDWVVDADIERYFERVPHDRLLIRLERSIGAGPLTELIAVWLESGAENGVGLPQGSPLSPLLSNLYLDDLDEALDGRGLRLVRFADDFVLLCRSRERAERALDHAAAVLEEHGLRLNRDKTRIVPFDQGFRFLGHLFVRSLVLPSPRPDDGEETEGDALLRALAIRDAAAEAEEAAAEERDRQSRAAGLDPALRTLHVQTPRRRLALRNEAFTVVERDDLGGERELIAIHHHHLDRIDLGPEADADAEALRWALATDTELAFVDGHGATHGRLTRPEARRAALHLDQARHALDEGLRLDLARRIVDGRLRNQRALLRRLNRSRKLGVVEDAVLAINALLRRLDTAADVAALLGFEGQGAARYWPALAAQIEGEWEFEGRRRRPPPDPVNAVLSYLSGLLERDVAALIARHGLHPGFGVLHSPQDRHDAGIYDLMEEFRAPLMEGLAVTLFNRRTLRPDHFSRRETGEGEIKGCRIDPDAVGAIIRAYEQWVRRPVASPRDGKRTTWRGLIGFQAQALAAHVQGREPYRAYVMDY
ncbi:CRISPR-associated endonuclease Cas1 [Azospirillum lipoferum]|uniref:CRISPR-associated endonuclease Cas1 n=1 Tax=Azospirillum lipoferum (strain 4B) TaxID=862719 RepID=G7ZE23_AZOL4|nr:CRISPR-associated endonuclease Cas1 [Azospirillum lipoferum]CBS89272.1 putative RNA-directed DNA polymerase [Azospirillum lipoferum 4B]